MLSIQRCARAYGRLLAMVMLLLLAVLMPFALWGDNMDGLVLIQLSDALSAGVMAAAGFVLLVLDVVLPMPSSVISMMLCLVLGPFVGAVVVFAGMACAFMLGYLLGALLPHQKLRHWMGESAWASFAGRISSQSLFWLAATRPIPVLAEVCAVMAGVARVPLARALPHVFISCALVAATYAIAASAGLAAAQTSMPLLVVLSAVLPCVFWCLYKLLARQRPAPDQPQP